VQSVMGASATEAGTTITPMMLGWVAASVIGGRLLLRRGYRSVALAGMALLTLGALLVSLSGADATRLEIMVYLTLMGVGMGLSVPSFLIAVQSSVEKRALGTATSTLQFSRSIGGTLGVSIMGAYLTVRLADALTDTGLALDGFSLETLDTAIITANPALRDAMALAVEGVFVLAFVAALLGLFATALAPGGRVAQLRRSAAQSGDAPAPAGH